MEAPLLQILFEDEERRPLTVSELNSEVRGAVERQFSNVWVEGEVVGFNGPASGHWYFSLNDGTAQIKCVCWKGTNYRVRYKPQNGNTVRIRGKLTFWETKGELKLTVESLEPAGEGALRAAFEQIKAKLEAEGLFEPALKRPLPFFPRKVAVITSATGAAYHDIHNVLTRRAGSVSIVLIPSLVQGEGAADNIRQAVLDANVFNRTLPQAEKIDVMIVGRGGGSAEDLWAFNDEQLARAIRASQIPIISAVGHEIDWTIADMVADLRAPTPSAAAEVVAGREEDILCNLKAREERLMSIVGLKMINAVNRAREAVGSLQSGFASSVQRARTRYSEISARLTPATLSAKTASIGNSLAMLEQRRMSAINAGMNLRFEHLRVQMAKLDALSPLAVLTRGYSITQTADGRIVRTAVGLEAGDKLKIRLERGNVNAEVLSVDE